MKILYLVRSVSPYWSNRIDVDYIIEALIKEGNEVFIYDIKQRMLLNCNSEGKKFYFNIPKLLEMFPFYLVINFFVFWWFLKKSQKSYDVCHILYIREEQLLLSSLIRKCAPKLILTIYGSDFNNKNFIKNRVKKLYFLADIITATNQKLLEKLIQENPGYQLENKTKVLMLPQIRFNQYFNFDFEDKKLAKQKLSFSKYNKVIIVGTSAAEYEQHIEIIEQLAKIENYNLLFVFPLTYGSGNFKKYIDKVKNVIEKKINNNNTLVLTEYMTETELADLRKASDIFINLRKNDQLVASMLESFLSGVEVITGSWLPYNILNKIGISVKQINNISEINTVLLEVIDSISVNRKIALEKNRDIIKKEYSYTDDLLKWMDIYK